MREFEYHKFSRPYRSHGYFHVQVAIQDILRGHRNTQSATHDVGMLRLCTCQCATAPQVIKEVLDLCFDAQPGIGIVRLEHSPGGRLLAAFLNEIEETANRYIPPLVIVARQCTRSLYQYTFAIEGANSIDRFACIGIYVHAFLGFVVYESVDT